MTLQRSEIMCQKQSFRFFRCGKVIAILQRLYRSFLIFPILLCISCTSYKLASHESRAIDALSDSGKNRSSLSQQCKPLSEGLYVVQAGAFKHISYARALRENLEKKGYESYMVVSGFDEDKRIFRVLIGRFADRKQAQVLSEDIKKKENLDVIVVSKPPRDTFVVQAGCFTDMVQAKSLRKKLADNGHNAYITISGTGNDKQYNVLLGEYLDRARAEKIAEEISKKENIKIFVNII